MYGALKASQAMTRRGADGAPDSARGELAIIAALAIVSVVFFVAFPQVDLTFSGWFYTPGSGFLWNDNDVVRTLYFTVLWVPRLALILLFIVVVGSFFVREGWLHVHRLRLIFLFMAGALGAGVVVNSLLKEHWGRARPVAVAQFGGTAQYTPPYKISPQCQRNCAFTSGHAAIAFSLLALGRLRSVNAKRARRRWLAIGVAAGTFVGLARIAQGGHFLSDVVFSFFVVYIVIEVVDRAFQWFITAGQRPSESADPREA